LTYLPENRRAALRLFDEAMSSPAVAHRGPLLARAIRTDPTLDTPRIALFNMLHRTDIIKNAEHGNIAKTIEPILPRPNGDLPQGCEQIPQELRAFVAKMDTVDVPAECVVSPHWRKQLNLTRSIALGFEDPRRIVQFAQSRFSYFDHRAYANIEEIIGAKRQYLHEAFSFDPFDIPEIKESPHSVDQTLMYHQGRHLSSTTLWHAGFLMRILEHVDTPSPRILEIGGGYGGLAMLFAYGGRCGQYVIADLAESLIFAYAFLRLTFPDATVRLCADSGDFERASDADFVLVPAQYTGELAGQSFDVAVNTGSIQEMPMPTARYYMDLIQNQLDVDYFYSMNYLFEAKDNTREAAQAEVAFRNLASPELDPYWDLLHFEINPPHISVDSGCNWGEVLVRRNGEIDPAARSSDDVLRELETELFGSQAWFGRAWLGLWRQPTRRLVDRYLAGITAFVHGQTPVPANFSMTARKLSLEDLRDQIGEVIYWRERRDSLPE
jgi:putative sugar O-methyltransferase